MNKKVISWCMYDWANSVFFTTVAAGFFPIFFKQYWNADVPVTLSTERLGWILAVTGFLMAVFSPVLGTISDFRRLKKKLLFISMCIGSVATFALYYVPQGDWVSAAILYGVALFFCSTSCVFYDALLVNVTTPDKYDAVSANGFSLGYLGGGLLFIVNVLMFQNPEWFGFSSGVIGVRFSFVTVAVWWFLFTLPLMKNVDEPQIDVSAQDKTLLKLLVHSVLDLKHTFAEIFQQKNIFYFVVAYWFYIDGVGTVISMAVDFGMSMGFQASDLIKALLLTQFVGFPAAYFAGYFSGKFGNKNIILLCLGIYAFVVIGASLMSQPWHFYFMAAMIGLAQGGVQALSRSLFAQLIPQEKSGQYFGFFNLLGKFAAIMGPVLIAVTARVTSSPQKTILSLFILFVLGAYFLRKVQVQKV
jgi:UMF1 family MFS transporter